MNGHEKKDELLLEIADRSHVQFISDLGYIDNPIIIQKAVNAIPVDKYDVREWNYAVIYIHQVLNKKVEEFRSAKEARDFLLNQ